VTALWAALGVGFGAVIKNQVFAIVALLVWVSVVDPILGSVAPSVGRYTPIAASAAITGDPTHYLVAPLAGGLLLLAYATVFIAAGHMLVARRDVT